MLVWLWARRQPRYRLAGQRIIAPLSRIADDIGPEKFAATGFKKVAEFGQSKRSSRGHRFYSKASDPKMASRQRTAIVSVYDKTGLLDLAKGLVQNNVRILASGGTARMIRESGFPVE